ncbi:MAG: hypothetical protein ACKVPX_04965 [Myxococcaceae bacterium]
MSRPSPFAWALLATSATGLLAFVGIALLVIGPSARWAQVGALTSTVVGFGSLFIKRVALRKSLGYGLGAVGVTLLLRLLVWGVGAGALRARGIGPIPFTLGYLAIFGVLLWVELGYLAAEARSVRK